METQTDSPLIVSFATNDDHYRPHGERLIEQCNEHGMDCHVEFFEPWAGKRETCCYRPEYMIRLLLYYERPLVWVDADCDILGPIEIPDSPIGLVRNPDNHPDNPFAAAIFMTSDISFLGRWKEYCDLWTPGKVGSHRRLCWAAAGFHWSDMTPYVKGKFVLRTQHREWRL